ncbi:ABC transporter permease [Ruminococcus flavefaciens]|uniref:ABC transporter permease n=1 Tax=Ruminococcus flavefaciens TaxID=1265 RepID=UPI000564F981|nr:FtsX-like permease family protein [Ruminococcus flavefaciens]
MENNISFGARPKNPLRRRILRDLRREWKRYLMIFAMLVVTIGFVSGMYVANNSMLTSLNENADKFNRESGHFELSAKADDELIAAIETGETADVVAALKERAYSEAEDEVTDAVKEKLEENVRGQVEKGMRDSVTAAVDEQLKAAEAMGMKADEAQRQQTIDEAFDAAMSENYDKAVEDALAKAYESEEYTDALSDAMDEAKKEIDKTIDEEYTELADRYKLNEKTEPVPVKVYELFCKEQDEKRSADGEAKGKIRVYSERDKVNRYDILSGEAPKNDREIMIDRMHADNAGIKVGDTIYVGRADFTVSGLCGFSDYTTLFENNTDTIFDAITFDVGMTTDEGFERVGGAVRYVYAYIYKEEPGDVFAEKEQSEGFLKSLITQTASAEKENEIKDFVPAYLNHAITFAPNDFGNDKAMGGVLLYILVAVLAFISAVTINTTLDKEASVIGTLRASGFTKGELVRYYMSAPVIVVAAAAIVGNILGYTCMKKLVVAMYYNSYSLPAYRTIWTSEAFLKTTIIPVIIMLVINFVVITRKLKLSPLRFLRHDLKKVRRKKAVRLPEWKFFARFRMRVFLQNIPNYIMMFVGICFIMLMLSMAVGMPATLKYYQDSMTDMMIAKEQMVLISSEDDDGNTIKTSVEGAEPFSMTALERREDNSEEEVSVYGTEQGSRYIGLSDDYFSGAADDEVYISTSYAEKFGVEKGDTIVLSEKYENVDYTWKVYDVYDYPAGIAVFMPNDRFNEIFDREEGSFSGYLSDNHIDDIDEKYIAKTITADDILKAARQLDHSMGSYMLYFQYVCVIVAAIILYLLTKIIIEKNERSISMVKILGYENGEISSLYLVTTAIVVFVTEFLAIFIGYQAMKVVWKIMLSKLGGYFAFVMPFSGFVKEFLLVFAAYLIITVFDFIRIKKIPKVLALKNVE